VSVPIDENHINGNRYQLGLIKTCKPKEGALAEILFNVLGAIRGLKKMEHERGKFPPVQNGKHTFMDMRISSSAKTKFSHSLGRFDSKG
jgi:hypothetical protein